MSFCRDEAGILVPSAPMSSLSTRRYSYGWTARAEATAAALRTPMLLSQNSRFCSHVRDRSAVASVVGGPILLMLMLDVGKVLEHRSVRNGSCRNK